ncbi:MAG: hydrogenase [Pyrinomonadaceae bacterium]
MSNNYEYEIIDRDDVTASRLMQFGMVLFLLGLLTGFAVPMLQMPRMGLASHMQGIINGMLLVIMGVVWTRLRLSGRTRSILLGLLIYGTFANWLATLLAAAFGVGRSMPIAAAGRTGLPALETLVDFLLFSLSFAMIAVSIIVIKGLRLPAASGE